MFGEESSIMCLYKGTIHTSQNQSQIHEDFNTPYVGIPYIIVTMFISTSNFMLIYGFYKTSRTFTINTKLFIYLSVIDIAYISFTTLYTFADLVECWLISILDFVMELAYFLGITVFATISLLRYRSIQRPLHSINSIRLIFILIVQVIACGLLTGSVFILFYFEISYEQMLYVLFALPISKFLTALFVLVVNLMSYKKIKSLKRMSGFSNDVMNTSAQRQKTLSKANISLLCITVFYIFCPLPLLITVMFDLEKLLGHSWGWYLLISTHIVYITNTGINSIIVILRTKNLREFYKKKCCCITRIYRRAKSQNSTQLATI